MQKYPEMSTLKKKKNWQNTDGKDYRLVFSWTSVRELGCPVKGWTIFGSYQFMGNKEGCSGDTRDKKI